MKASWLLRAAATPERFLTRGFARLVSRTPKRRTDGCAVKLPRDLATFLALAAPRFGGFAFAAEASDLSGALAAAKRSASGRARLFALLAGAVPFGTARDGAIAILALEGGVVGKVDPAVPGAPKLLARDVSTFALALALEEDGSDEALAARAKLPTPRVAEQESVRAAFERTRAVIDLVLGDDAAVKRAAKKLAHRPLDVPPPAPPSSRRAGSGPRITARKKRPDRDAPLALGALVEAFFRQSDAEARSACDAHRGSSDAIVASAAIVLAGAIEASATTTTTTTAAPRTRRATKRGAATARPSMTVVRDLARRRRLALGAVAKATRSARASSDRLALTRAIVAHVDALRDVASSSGARDEALLALGELGDPAVVPSLAARAVTGDIAAVDMLAALGEPAAVPHLEALLHREPTTRPGARLLEAAVVRALATLDAKHAAPALRAMLDASPMKSWRDGINLGALVKELVSALGTLRDGAAGGALLAVLEETSQEYRAIAPTAAWALGRLRHVPALATLERRLLAPKDAATCEAVWAVGEIGSALCETDARARRRAIALLEGLAGLEPGAEIVRAVALAKMGAGPRTTELRRTLDHALWEPAFRQEETSRRRAWALESLGELAGIERRRRADPTAHAFFLGHEAVRHLVTRDDHRVRIAAERAFAAWGVETPKTRRYYRFVLDDLERRGGLDALHDAVRDPLGIFRHNVATRIAERGHASSARPLAEAVARLFAEPATSTYEYDDAPAHLVAFVRALAKLNRPEGNEVLVDGLRSGNHQVRAVVAENAPEDERFVPELMAMLGDPRSFLRSRAERTLAAHGVRTSQSDPPPRLVEV